MKAHLFLACAMAWATTITAEALQISIVENSTQRFSFEATSLFTGNPRDLELTADGKGKVDGYTRAPWTAPDGQYYPEQIDIFVGGEFAVGPIWDALMIYPTPSGTRTDDVGGVAVEIPGGWRFTYTESYPVSNPLPDNQVSTLHLFWGALASLALWKVKVSPIR